MVQESAQQRLLFLNTRSRVQGGGINNDTAAVRAALDDLADRLNSKDTSPATTTAVTSLYGFYKRVDSYCN
jgi:hypothetical protein